MQIHELNSFIGTPSATDYLAIDDGTETNKVPATSLGVSTQMTQAEAEAGTVTDPRVVSPSVFKASVESIAETVAETREVLVVTVASFSSLPQTVTNSNITSDMVVVNSVLGTPSAQTSDWTVTASNGSLTIAGSISGSTSVELYLMKSRSGNGMTSIIKNSYVDSDSLFTYNTATVTGGFGGNCRLADGLCLLQLGGEFISAPSTWTDVGIGTLSGIRATKTCYGIVHTNSGTVRSVQIGGGSQNVNIRTLGTSTSDKTFRGFIVIQYEKV